jgi:hypothetical protein
LLLIVFLVDFFTANLLSLQSLLGSNPEITAWRLAFSSHLQSARRRDRKRRVAL